jgi:hypothetical protein
MMSLSLIFAADHGALTAILIGTPRSRPAALKCRQEKEEMRILRMEKSAFILSKMHNLILLNQRSHSLTLVNKSAKQMVVNFSNLS